jgi:DNA (cytosine-5)-methyltransferase 1
MTDAQGGARSNMTKPILLDLFCGAGGCAMGYYRAGFDVVGVDIKPQPHFHFEFIQADALEYLATADLSRYAAIHASPPCQAFTLAGRQWRQDGREYPDLVVPVRELLRASGKPYVIENVPGAPLLNPTVLNGAFFGMNLRRTRLFETSFQMPFILLPREEPSNFKMGRKPRESDPVVPVGHFSGVQRARQVMEIDWMNQGELAQAIPPAYTEYIGKHLMEAIGELAP